MGQCWQRLTTLFVVMAVTIAKPAWSDTPLADPIYSEAFCLKIFAETVEKARSSTWQISDRDRHILTQCRSKFPPKTNSQSVLPTGSDCVYVIKTLVQGGLSKVKEIELPEEQIRSIERCDEVIKYHQISSGNMLPTLKLSDRVVVDRTIYQTQLPQRGDTIVFNLPNPAHSENSSTPLTQRIIGLPTEKVKIKNSKVYINNKLLDEDYIIQSTQPWHESILVPKNSYLVFDDNRRDYASSHTWKIVARAAIVGKVIWHFGSK
jgi:signal peptidase I